MFLITTFCPFYTVEGSSMSPTLRHNDLVCIKKTKSFKHGDLIVINYNNKLLVRRVIALSEYSANGRPLVTVEKSTQYAGQVHHIKKLNTVGSPQLI